MKKMIKVVFALSALCAVSSASAYWQHCWINDNGVQVCNGPGANCWINANGVQVCNGGGPVAPGCWINPNGVEVCGQQHCWINPNGVQVCN